MNSERTETQSVNISAEIDTGDWIVNAGLTCSQLVNSVDTRPQGYIPKNPQSFYIVMYN